MSSNGKHKYRFGADLNFNESEKPFQKAGKFLLYAVGASSLLTIVLYCLFALLFNTDKEARLKREIVMYKKTYPQLEPQKALLENSLTVLESKDDAIYGEVFQNSAPAVDPINNLGTFYGADTIADTKLISYTYDKACRLTSLSGDIDKTFQDILVKLASPGCEIPPMDMPVHDVAYPQIGAGQGMKFHPFLKAYVEHDGLDFIVHQGDPVFASAEGRVVNVVRSDKGLGNMVSIAHEGGYVTNYAHLSWIGVRAGQAVRRGMKIGSVGMSGASYAPHLHYEVLKDGVSMNPVNYMFASLTPDEYANMLYMSINTRQSLD